MYVPLALRNIARVYIQEVCHGLSSPTDCHRCEVRANAGTSKERTQHAAVDKRLGTISYADQCLCSVPTLAIDLAAIQ